MVAEAIDDGEPPFKPPIDDSIIEKRLLVLPRIFALTYQAVLLAHQLLLQFDHVALET